MAFRNIVFSLTTALLVLGCNESPAPTGAASSSALVRAPSPPSARPAASTTAAPASSPSGEAKPAQLIACGTSSCRVGAELCCDLYGKKKKLCAPAPASLTEKKMLEACGTDSEVLVLQCDDSGDCAGDEICTQPMRHGSGSGSWTTQECLAQNDRYADAERCVQGGVCKRPGIPACGKNGLCQPGKKK